jgi:hypothetical protein
MKPLERDWKDSVLKLEERVKALEVSRKGYTGKTILPDGSFDIPRATEILGLPKDYVCVSAVTPELIEMVYENLRLSPLESIDLIRELVEALHHESGDIVKGGIQEEYDEI